MDSLTQIVLGAATGEIVLGRKVGNKAMLWGAVAGTIPDLDVFVGMLFDTVTRLEVHRGFSHSILFSIIFAPIFGYIVHKFYKNKTENPSVKSWSFLFFWGLFTHPLLDAHTTWGTQLFWPHPYKVAYHNIFVVDPLYTLPFLSLVLISLFLKRTNPLRLKLTVLGLVVSSLYMLVTICIKFYTLPVFENSLAKQRINYQQISTRPTPLNAILWNANVLTRDSIFIGNYSLFDHSKNVPFYSIPKDHHLLGDLMKEDKVQRLIYLTQGWFTVTKKDDSIFINDLRFGQMGYGSNAPFVFSFEIIKTNGGIEVIENRKDPEDGLKQLAVLWERLKGRREVI